MNILDMIIQVITALVGTFGFGILFNIRGKKLFLGALGGMVSWLLFLLLGFLIENEALRYFIVSIFSTIYAEILARVLKTPAASFSIITLIPLIPGSALYDTASFAMSGNLENLIPKFVSTVELTVALSLGIVIVTAIFRHLPKKRNP